MEEIKDERIPPAVIEGMARSADCHLPPGSAVKRELHRTLNAYEHARELPHAEPDMRARLSGLFVFALPRESGRPLTGAQRMAIERCAQGEPYRLCEA
jgi:hypothetical protein